MKIRVLLLNQCFYPDVVSTAQHLSDLARGLSRSGADVTVVCSSRAYSNPEQRFPAFENWEGISVYRVPTTGFGKGAKWRRACDFASFLIMAALRLLVLRRFDIVVALTTPPIVSCLGAFYSWITHARFVYWVMDLNPDEAIAAAWLKENSLVSKFLESCSRFSFRRAEQIIVLDHFMRERIQAKGIPGEKISVIPPWSHDDEVRFDDAARDSFRKKYGLENSFVVMYAGNHSPCHPLSTLLEAAYRLQNRPDICFCFAGGGSEHQKIRELAAKEQLTNVVCFPYQPLSELSGLLSAADLHVVVMGDPFVGMIHPCKVYNILQVQAPLLYIGPEHSHIADILSNLPAGNLCCSARHNDVGRVQAFIESVAGSGRRASYNGVASRFSGAELLPRLQEIVLHPGQNG